MNEKILLVEDEKDLSIIVADTLEKAGFRVIAAFDGKEGLSKFIVEQPDIVIADVMMPKLDGFKMAKKIRGISQITPLIFLTAKSSIDDIEAGFDIGANDYIRKPFELKELIIRINAQLRMARHDKTDDSVIRIGRYTFSRGLQILAVDDREIELTNIETRLLEPLSTNIGRTVSASDLMMSVWGRDDISNRNSLHGVIHKLRHAFRYDQSVKIINERGFGYMLVIK